MFWVSVKGETLDVVVVVLACATVGAALLAVFLKSLVLSAVALGVGSAALAALLFVLGAPYAGGFELSVGAGLISVLFIIAISLTESRRKGGGGRNAP